MIVPCIGSVSLPAIAARSFFSGLTALLLTIALMPFCLSVLRRLRVVDKGGKGDSEKLDALHASKCNTLTMGGIVPLVATVAATVLWVDTLRIGVLLALGSGVLLACIGAWDDLAKLRKSGHGLWPREKFLLVSGVGLLSGVLCQQAAVPHESLFLFTIFPLWVSLVVGGTANAVNLTDGLDGLAGGCLALAAAGLAVAAAVCGHSQFSSFLHLEHVAPGVDISILCAALAGAAAGFLVFNAHPAKVFMGDTGALSLGGILAMSAVLVRLEFFLLLLGGVFVIEALSVILQVLSYKLWKKRVFLIAPLHHHFEFKGWTEVTVTTRFWLCGAFLSSLFIGFLLWR